MLTVERLHEGSVGVLSVHAGGLRLRRVRLWIDSPFLNHPAEDAIVDFNGVLVGGRLGNANALPAF